MALICISKAKEVEFAFWFSKRLGTQYGLLFTHLLIFIHSFIHSLNRMHHMPYIIFAMYISKWDKVSLLIDLYFLEDHRVKKNKILNIYSQLLPIRVSLLAMSLHLSLFLLQVTLSTQLICPDTQFGSNMSSILFGLF